MCIPVVTREYTPGPCRNSRKPMRLPPRHEMRPNSPALHAEQLRFPNQTHKDPRFAWLNSRESPTRLSQDEKNTDVTSERKIDWCTPNQLKMKHISPSLNPQHSFITHHIQQVSWHPLQQSRDYLRHPSQVYRIIYFSKATGGKTRAPHIVWRWELIPCLRMKR